MTSGPLHVSRDDECRHQPSSHFTVETTPNGTQAPKVIAAGSRHSGDVCLHGQVSVEEDSEVTDYLHRLNNIGSNGQAPVGPRHLTEVRRRSKPKHFGLHRVQLETLGCAPAGNGSDRLLYV